MASVLQGSYDPRRAGWKVDVYLILATLGLLAFGLLSVYSKSVPLDEGATFRRQLLNVAVGIVPFAIFATVHPKFWQRNARWVYGVNLLLLAAVRLGGKDVKGAERWLDVGPLQFQPSELAKLLVILTIASFFANRAESIDRLSTFVLSFLHVAFPMALILIQPHLGATIVIFVMWIGVSLVARVPALFLGATLAAFASVALLVFTVPAVSGKLLRGYQQDRIAGLKSKGTNTRDQNWQTDRAEIAFGVGGVFGTGFMEGRQKTLGFIPEQQTDFIFTVVGEEGGLVGSALLLLVYAFFFYRAWLAMVFADDPFYRAVAGGIVTILFFHTFVNIAMVLHILPVVGLWLPFMSYGGTAMWLCLACVGLLLNIRRRSEPGLF